MSDRTLTLQDFIRLLAARVNCDESMAADFIRAFSSATAHGLVTDGFVNITGLGSFRVVNDVDDTPTVEFAPASSLAASVNEPFAMFEPVELADSFADEEAQQSRETAHSKEVAIAEEVALTEKVAHSEEATPPPIPDKFRNPSAPADNETSQTTEVPAADEQPKGAQVVTEVPSEAVQTTIPREVEREAPRREAPLPVLLEPESHVTVKRVGHTTLTLILAAAAALLAGVLIGLFLGYNFHRSISTLQERDIPLSPETVEDTEFEVPEELTEPNEEVVDDSIATEEIALVEPAEPVVVTDTVGPGNYLSIMAKRHYGNAKFWVYIYLENKDKIRNPNNLEDGMVLIIPPAEKYGIDPDDKESLARAQREATRVANEL